MDDYYSRELVAHLVDVRDEIVRSDARQGDRSQISGYLMRDGFDAVIAQLDGGLDYIAVTADRGFERVTTQLAELAVSVEEIKHLAGAPRSAEAAERRQAGIYALDRNLIDDAITELLAAAELNRFDPFAHFFLGDAYHTSGDDALAAEAYAKAVKYRLDQYPQWTITAARRAAEAYRKVNPDDARQQAVLTLAFQSVDLAAEVALDLARFDEDMLIVALRLAPDLLLVEAGIRGLPNLEEAAVVVLQEEHGLARRYKDALEIKRGIDSKLGTGIPQDDAGPPLGPLPEEASASVRLTALAVVLPQAQKHLRGLAGQARALADRRTADALSRITQYQHQRPARTLPAPRRPPNPEAGLRARLFPAPGAREAYHAAMSAYDAEVERYENQKRNQARAEAERRDALAAAKHDAEEARLDGDMLHSLAEHAEQAATDLTPRYTKGVRTPRRPPTPGIGQTGY